MKGDFSNASESFKRLNPAMFGLGGLSSPKPQPNPVNVPAPTDGRKEKGPRGLATRNRRTQQRVRITFVSYRRREIDDDNLAAGCKHLRDAIAASLGLDDSQRGIAWEYGQTLTQGREGVAVKIEMI